MENLSMLTDFYQFTMMNGYLKTNSQNDVMIFDLFYRKNPSNGGYAIACGIDQIIDYIENLEFTDDDIDYLKKLKIFDLDFINELKNFKFSGEIYAVEEGSFVFPNEPIIRVKARAFEAQLIETTMLSIINFQTLIATKASRICQVAGSDPIVEFGLRRAQGPHAGLYGARAAVIGGCVATSNVLAGKMFNIPVMGTHAHSWVQKFDNELEAFRAYAKAYPSTTVLLLDSYDTINSGLPNAITVFKELRKDGYEPLGVRIDSGDLEYLSKEIRSKLDEEGFQNVGITASNDLDEFTIIDLKSQGAKINSWGVGTKLITSSDCPSLGGVYKLSAVEENGVITPKIKISESPEKINNPGYKKVYRIFNSKNNKAEVDLISLEHEQIDFNQPLTVFHPIHTWKKKTFTEYYAVELLKPLFINGKCIRKKKDTMEYKAYVEQQKKQFWPQYLRTSNAEPFKVDLSKELWKLKSDLLDKHK
ncbi:MAG: nicotinate phosphoribosyltransferase [Filifactoraceae bacterium]